MIDWQAVWLSIRLAGVTTLVLAMIEDGAIRRNLSLRDPVRAARGGVAFVSGDRKSEVKR